ncbi:hypothetical protein W97_07816 [Coniosporium apollinis CBS 100218]|uniref:Peptidase S53 domain-containing protein n=1 Tax=Coniosporium apollinis (strain CBS 100218) TaxID=1168221 RepID=R7Z381_CONA1|nr:uncharacterized protein W97_07816 [Coniosporium apollinis CBS 100218]EON68558.1 hypothetical protein W97_07816 [Coniosporium apollinis CBS 100218]
MRTTALLAACLSFASIINGISIAMVENIGTVPNGWRMVGVPDPSQRLRFSIAVKQQNRALFEQTLYDVSTPSHPDYGRHLKRDELKDLVRPTVEATLSIIEWLEESGVRSGSIQDDGDWITFVATVEQAEKMMSTKFNYYQSHVRPNVRILRTMHYFVQDGLDQYIDMIQPTTRFPRIHPLRSPILGMQEVGASRANPNITACSGKITPSCLRELYNIKGFRVNSAKGGFIGVSGFLDQYARYADLDVFLDEYAPWVQNGTFTHTFLNGSVMEQNSTNSSIEANLDIQYTASLSYPLRNHFYSTPGRGELVPDLDQPTQSDNLNEPYLEFFTYLLSLPDGQLPQTLTTSYGENEQSVPEPYARRVCDMAGQLGLRGVSVIFASGDSGVGSACRTNDGTNATRFMPVFPASCPYVTSVGGTYGVEPERAIAFSSGGFSDLFPRPAY